MCITCYYPNRVYNSTENSSTTENSHLEKYDNGKVSIGECPSNSPFLKNNEAEAHCF